MPDSSQAQNDGQVRGVHLLAAKQEHAVHGGFVGGRVNVLGRQGKTTQCTRQAQPQKSFHPTKVGNQETFRKFTHSTRQALWATAYLPFPSKAWNLVDEMNTLAGREVVTTKKGGKTGGGAEVTPPGLSLVAQYHQFLQQFDAFARHQSAHLSLAQPSGA